MIKSPPNIDNYVIGWRRHFHKNPELSFKEFQTSRVLAAELKKLGMRVKLKVGGTGVVGLLQGCRKGKTVALRADMDALPVNEDNRTSYVSNNPGIMHACGHDGHMAMLLGAAKMLSSQRDVIKGQVKFLFQPGEETPPGGALGMIKDGAMEAPRVNAVFALHLDSSLPTGKVGLCKGPMMAASDNFEITIAGKGGHAARPHDCLDPVTTAAQIIMGLQTIASRKVDPVHPAVVTVGQVQAGSKHNIVPQQALLTGTARTIDFYSTKMMPIWIRQLAEGIARANGLKASLRYERGYPVLFNDPGMVDFCEKVIASLHGKKTAVRITEPMMGGEDMAYFLQKAPGAFLRLGSRKDRATAHPWHHPKFAIDEKALPLGAEILTAIALNYLSQ
ncbi:MAG: amidohydrolase [Candidatus Edwardsbacteria bacterium]|nr:amidohydrolase [Candidatus Edwardsbacteria bacterium]MBU1576789.1 amidohydrolase [Candidatus Edwardsbacteria bacterium]MBU2462696.1 amidohydrolase [Candidatus Edwardsbacteria bacterium]MBU2593354.1 amidohydrolase [Candidatus Edwardsbacteria bacterium]